MDRNYFSHERERFVGRYADLSDGELINIAREPWALSEAAWEALEDEFDRRGLELPRPVSVPQVESLEQRNLVLLRRFRDLPEALLAKGKLDSEGIPCFLADENMVRLDWFISNLLGGVKILVDAEDFAEAARLLNEPIPEGLDFEGTESYEQPRCPECQSLDVNFEELYRPIAFGSLFLNFPLPVHRSGWSCHSCGHTWRG
jgi:putative signal transducing protein